VGNYLGPRGGELTWLLTKVPPELLANWLYKKINGRATKLLIDRIEVQISKNEIERVISEKTGNK
jgi:hypothetical protein